jgi:F0F1-type ATP synthase epsilon subunit
MLKQCSSIEISFIVNNLQMLLFLPGDVIIRQGEDSHQLYFINRGMADVHMEKLSVCKEFVK